MSINELPENLPIPKDDGKANHLTGALWPDVSLMSTSQELTNVSKLDSLIVIYVYPMTAKPGTPLPTDWDEIPGARGCTPQSCSFRDHHADIQSFNAQIYGLSAQSTEYQAEAKNRLHLPFDLLSDEELSLKNHLNLPTFKADEKELYNRITFIISKHKIEKVFYPVFPPNENADHVVAWLKSNA